MIYNIQLLRFLSAFSVLCAHLILFGNKKYGLGHPELNIVADYLMMGVDIFFIISGFIMMETARKGIATMGGFATVKSFLYRRIIRIYPVWWLLCLALLPVFMMRPEWINSGAEHATSFIHSFFLIPSAGVPLIMVGWTLEYEMMFYLIFAMTLWLPPLLQFITVAGLFLGVALVGCYYDVGASPLVEMMTSSLLLYFVVGMGIQLFWRRLPCHKIIPFIIAIGIGVAGYFVTQYRLGEIDRFLHFGLISSLIFLFFIYFDRLKIILSERLYVLGGDISYALYLVHILVISVVGRIYLMMGGAEFLPPLIVILIMMMGSIIGAFLLFYCFERPVLKYLRRWMT